MKRGGKKWHRAYERIAQTLHDMTCDDTECLYGKEKPEHLRHSDDLPWPEQRRRAGLRLEQVYICQRAVMAENIAATILGVIHD